ncbi:MAG: hypothetical protein KAR00_01055 [Candidatus Pacebacteria bacterium]|nr:hypothetical protein [Candidatus Paceibacterota bacterium]
MTPLWFFNRPKHRKGEIAPEDIFIDSSNLPQFNTYQFEGRLEKPIGMRASFSVGLFFCFVALIFTGRLYFLQVQDGEMYALKSENNRLQHTLVFSERGIIYDRNGVELAWNEPNLEQEDFSSREYISAPGFAHILGYLKYPSKDAGGFYYRETFLGKDGVENTYDVFLAGKNGLKITETDALGNIKSESIIEPSVAGKSIVLSIDARIQEELYGIIEKAVRNIPFNGGSGVIMNVETGEILSLVSVPEYDPKALTEGEPDKVSEYVKNPQEPFLNRVTAGLYTPGSIIKPFLAIGALTENIISPEKEILSTGSISIENPYFPGLFSVFRDWKAHGLVDMRRALAVSSDVYFYQIGGGYKDQKGLGIENIEKYLQMFGFSEPVGIDLPHEEIGLIPTPEWKAKVFNGEEWRVGDTYNTAIGQYGMQTTPLQAVRAIAAIANEGKLLRPHIVRSKQIDFRKIEIQTEYFNIVQEGMQQGVTEGTATGLWVPYVSIAAKTGTAELGVLKRFVNSWVIGFFPYENPRYAFAITLEKGPVENLVGGVSVARQLFDWMSVNTPEYFAK